MRMAHRKGKRTLIARPRGDAVAPRLAGRPAVARGLGITRHVDPWRASSRDDRAWAVMPSASNPTVLIPVGGRAGASALRQFNDSMSQPARVRKAAAGAAVRVGGGPPHRPRPIRGDAAGDGCRGEGSDRLDPSGDPRGAADRGRDLDRAPAPPEPQTGAPDHASRREGPGVRQDRMERPDQGARSERRPRPEGLGDVAATIASTCRG